jgi:hypothetical protein
VSEECRNRDCAWKGCSRKVFLEGAYTLLWTEGTPWRDWSVKCDVSRALYVDPLPSLATVERESTVRDSHSVQVADEWHTHGQ